MPRHRRARHQHDGDHPTPLDSLADSPAEFQARGSASGLLPHSGQGAPPGIPDRLYPHFPHIPTRSRRRAITSSRHATAVGTATTRIGIHNGMNTSMNLGVSRTRQPGHQEIMRVSGSLRKDSTFHPSSDGGAPRPRYQYSIPPQLAVTMHVEFALLHPTDQTHQYPATAAATITTMATTPPHFTVLRIRRRSLMVWTSTKGRGGSLRCPPANGSGHGEPDGLVVPTSTELKHRFTGVSDRIKTTSTNSQSSTIILAQQLPIPTPIPSCPSCPSMFRSPLPIPLPRYAPPRHAALSLSRLPLRL